jgi:ATP-binding cassette subfamily C protein/ATP-binding cassette subfamily C exporter for protease/lipase/ATP-binding cassette subfamily C protein EexD
MVAGLSLFLNLLALASPLYMFQVFDRVLASGRVETLVALTAVAAFALVCLGALEVIRSRSLARISTWLDRALARIVLKASVGEALAGRPIGAQAMNDLAQLRGFISSQGICPIFDAPWTPVFVAVIWVLHPWLGMLALVGAALLFTLALANELLTRAPLAGAGQAWLTGQRRYETALRNAEVVQAMGMLPALLQRWQADHERVLDGQARASDRTGWIYGISKFVRLFIQVAILGLGAYLVLGGALTSGGMIASSILLGRALAPVEQAIGAWKGFVAARASHDRLRRLLQRHPSEAPAIELPAPEGRISVDQLSFRAPDGRPILKGVSFALTAGEVLAVVGPSASGKSTLCRLLTGVWPPDAGHVRLDDAEVHRWSRVDFGRHVGYLPQDVELFAGSVRDNIARMTDAPDDAVIAAAQLAGVHEMILHLPEGYATDVGPQGAILSGGQRQCIGLARAMFGTPRVVVLDEPSASLDQVGESAVLDAIGRLKERGTTVVLVVHRPRLLTHVDKVLVLSEGAGVMFGPRDQILARIMVRGGERPAVAAAS